MAATTRTVTYEEWLQIPETQDGIEEVVSGEIRIMPPPKWEHTRIVRNLSAVLKNQVDERLVLVVGEQFGLVIRRNPLGTRVPDLAMFIESNIVEQDGYIHSPPEPVVEVLPPADTRSERAEKLRDYEEIGVPEVWVLSLETRTAEVLRLEKGKLRTVLVVSEGELRPVCFPEVVVDVPSIWPH